MFQWYCVLCLTLKTAAPFQSCFQSGMAECCVATNCQLNCQSMAVKCHGQQTLLSQKHKMLKSYLEHHHLSTIPETVVTFPSRPWWDAPAGQERLTASGPLFPEEFQASTCISYQEGLCGLLPLSFAVGFTGVGCECMNICSHLLMICMFQN